MPALLETAQVLFMLMHLEQVRFDPNRNESSLVFAPLNSASNRVLLTASSNQHIVPDSSWAYISCYLSTTRHYYQRWLNYSLHILWEVISAL